MATLRLIPKVTDSTTTVDVILGARQEHSIFYQFEGDVGPDRSGAGNAAAVGFLPYAMRFGLDIHVDGAVDFDLLAQLEESQDAWALWHPGLFRPVTITADEVRPTALPQTKTAVIGFSGGLDATYALHAHRRRLIGRRSLDVRFATLVHGFDIPLDKDDWFSDAKHRASAITHNYEVPLVAVRTNWRSLNLPWGQTHIFALSSVLHQFKGTVGHGVIAADEPYDGEIPGWGSNSITNQLMGGASFPIHATGAGKRRTEKAQAIRGEPAAYRNIRVCWEQASSSGNCGKCEKCVRTKLNFLAAGIDDTSALGGPVSADQVRGISIRSNVVMNFFHDLSTYPWSDYPEIKSALGDIVARGIEKNTGVRHKVLKYRRSLQKRGLWPK